MNVRLFLDQKSADLITGSRTFIVLRIQGAEDSFQDRWLTKFHHRRTPSPGCPIWLTH